jgi:hypothetical protein
MLLYRFFLTALLLTLFPLNETNAQSISEGSRSEALMNVQNYFQNTIGEDAHIFTGREYLGYAAFIKGHPFFLTDQMQQCEIFYDGTLYEDIPLLFDIVSQKIVMNRYNQNDTISLLNAKIKYFVLQGHRFENLTFSEGNEEIIRQGIYDILLAGKVNLLVKRIKNIKDGLKATDPVSFVEEDEFFVQKGKELIQVYSKNSVLEALNDKSNLVKIFTRKNHFRFKKNIEKELLQTVAYYFKLN